MLGRPTGPSPWNNEAEDASDGSAHRRESSDSSLAFVTTIKPASISVAGTSLLARSWIPTIPSPRAQWTDAGGHVSGPSPRASEDSTQADRQEQALDPKVLERALQRRRIIDELITTEEAYIRDLRFLANPIQRACKYHLLFKDLSRHTPVIDCPSSHMEIETTISKLLDISTYVNAATNNPKVKMAVEKTRALQTRLAFPDKVSVRRNEFGGPDVADLCGVLHVCWQTREAVVNGQYMAALLYREWLCLAIAEGYQQRYMVQVCVALSNLKLEEVDNNRGIQCHSARHSWKIVFMSGNQLYELMLTACSPKEELEWRSRLSQSSSAPPSDDQEPAEVEGYTAHSMHIKTLGTVYRKSGTHSGKLSIHRAATIGPKPPICQVILKNTSGGAKKQVTPPPSPSSSPAPISRSQTIPSPTARVAVIAPPRAERARLEALLADLWSRDVLPFPGLSTPRSRSEQLVRASASSVMRKLSSVSITSSFRRSSSLASLRADKGGAGEEGGAEPPSSSLSSPGPAACGSSLPRHQPPSRHSGRLLRAMGVKLLQCHPRTSG
ncbi:hypothetical protein VTJ83DRAFT_559 [Remersonia thermophila]|uniref:DH domain-containing protein n=1 Tax=Remersonia thermophila TaxID=72144 RepID=A0ABR4DLE9_9PEZI